MYRDLKLRAEDFAKRMANEIFTNRTEFDFLCAEQVPDDFITKIINDPKHIEVIKGMIHDAVLLDVQENPDDYVTDKDGEFVYSFDSCYDYGYTVDNYIEAKYEEERRSKLKFKYKIWVEIERIEIDEEGNETYHDEENPIGIAYRDTIEEAVELQNDIDEVFSEI
jgi:hypothetical protein